MKTCEHCGSPRMIYVRIDSDWASHAGEVRRLNPDEVYEPYDPTDERPDIEIMMCMACNRVR